MTPDRPTASFVSEHPAMVQHGGLRQPSGGGGAPGPEGHRTTKGAHDAGRSAVLGASVRPSRRAFTIGAVGPAGDPPDLVGEHPLTALRDRPLAREPATDRLLP